MPTKNRKVAVHAAATLACLAPSPVKLAPFFVAKKRGRGPKAPVFFSLEDAAPAWLRDAVHEAHQSDLPNDWIYEQCRNACLAIDDGALTEDTLSEYADGAVDVYTADRFAWAADMCGSSTFSSAEERDEEMGATSGDTCERLGRLQYHAIESIAATILRAYQEAGES